MYSLQSGPVISLPYLQIDRAVAIKLFASIEFDPDISDISGGKKIGMHSFETAASFFQIIFFLASKYIL